MRNSEPLTIDRKLEILHDAINKMVVELEGPPGAQADGKQIVLKFSVPDLIRLLEMETELAGKLAPQKTVIQWIDPYLSETKQTSETNPDPGETPPKAA